MTPLANLYAAASTGFHTSQSCGADGLYQHVSKFKTLNELQAFERAWTAAMLSVRDAEQSSAQPWAPVTGPERIAAGTAYNAEFMDRDSNEADALEAAINCVLNLRAAQQKGGGQ